MVCFLLLFFFFRSVIVNEFSCMAYLWAGVCVLRSPFSVLRSGEDQFQGTPGPSPAQDKVSSWPGYLAPYILSLWSSVYIFLINFWDRSDSVPTLLLICEPARSPGESESKPLVYTLHANGRMKVGMGSDGFWSWQTLRGREVKSPKSSAWSPWLCGF